MLDALVVLEEVEEWLGAGDLLAPSLATMPGGALA